MLIIENIICIIHFSKYNCKYKEYIICKRKTAEEKEIRRATWSGSLMTVRVKASYTVIAGFLSPSFRRSRTGFVNSVDHKFVQSAGGT